MKLLGLACLLLASCSDMPRARTESEIRGMAEDAADDVAGARMSELNSKIAELEGKVDSLEADNLVLKAEVERLSINDQSDTESVKRLFKNDKVFADRLGIPMEK